VTGAVGSGELSQLRALDCCVGEGEEWRKEGIRRICSCMESPPEECSGVFFNRPKGSCGKVEAIGENMPDASCFSISELSLPNGVMWNSSDVELKIESPASCIGLSKSSKSRLKGRGFEKFMVFRLSDFDLSMLNCAGAYVWDSGDSEMGPCSCSMTVTTGTRWPFAST
jgi:hypothetical protein